MTIGDTIQGLLTRAGLPPLPRTVWAAVDLDALTANLVALRSALAPGIGLELVVKADAYGHGAIAVAGHLEAAVDGFSVASLDEALELRSSGIRAPILVLYPVAPQLAPIAARERIAVTAADEVLLDRTIAVLAASRTEGRRSTRLELHVEIDTGLGRAGVLPARASSVVDTVAASSLVRLGGIWSHLQAPGDAVRSASQVAAFVEAHAAVGLPGRRAPRHLAASGGLMAGSAPVLERVRIGLALYGLVPDGLRPVGAGRSLARSLTPAMSLRALPIRVVDLPAGQGIGYGPSFTTARPSRIATLPVGYADGYARVAAPGRTVLVRGVRAPIVGTVAMDALMVDVTDVPGPPVGVDDEFVLIGRQGGEEISAAELAQGRTTISWEILATIARRVPRVYYAATGLLGLRTLSEERVRWWRRSRSGTAISATSRSTRS